jgi:hypothetical protein
VADEIVGDGELVLAGTEDRPVVVRGATIDQRLRVRARWTFFLGTVDRLIDGGLASGRAFGAPGLDLDHVSMSASRAVDTSAVAAEDYRRTSFARPAPRRDRAPQPVRGRRRRPARPGRVGRPAGRGLGLRRPRRHGDPGQQRRARRHPGPPPQRLVSTASARPCPSAP